MIRSLPLPLIITKLLAAVGVKMVNVTGLFQILAARLDPAPVFTENSVVASSTSKPVIVTDPVSVPVIVTSTPIMPVVVTGPTTIPGPPMPESTTTVPNATKKELDRVGCNLGLPPVWSIVVMSLLGTLLVLSAGIIYFKSSPAARRRLQGRGLLK